jgi:hypothetical protein
MVLIKPTALGVFLYLKAIIILSNLSYFGYRDRIFPHFSSHQEIKQRLARREKSGTRAFSILPARRLLLALPPPRFNSGSETTSLPWDAPSRRPTAPSPDRTCPRVLTTTLTRAEILCHPRTPRQLVTRLEKMRSSWNNLHRRRNRLLQNYQLYFRVDMYPLKGLRPQTNVRGTTVFICAAATFTV